MGTSSSTADGLPGVIWMLAASPRDLDGLALDREYKLLLARLRGRGVDKLRFLPSTRPEELVELLQDVSATRVVHFSGHGGIGGDGLAFEDAAGWAQLVNPEALASVFAVLGQRLSCVVLNACDSAHHAREASRHVPWAIGMEGPIDDETARGFAGAFYVALADGRPVDLAFLEALAWVRVRSPAQGSAPGLYRAGELHRGGSRAGCGDSQDALDIAATLDTQIRRLTLAGEDTSALSQRVVELRRSQRSGPGLEEGQILDGRYALGQVVGRGGFASVWRAYDRTRKGLVAIKVLHGQYAQDRSRRGRFEAGTRRMQALNHPGLVTVLDGPTEDRGHYFYVMPWYPGRDLRRARGLGQDGAGPPVLDREAALRALAPVLEGLAHAHQKGVVHRDIKPANVLLDEDGNGALSDFDLARDHRSTHGTRTGAMGTFIYAAPEQMRDASRVDARADVYSAGMTLIYVLLGRDPPAMLARTEPAILEDLPCGPKLRAALRKAVAYDLDARTVTCVDLTAALRVELAGEETEHWDSPEEAESLIGGSVGDAMVQAASRGRGGAGRRSVWSWAVFAVMLVAAVGLWQAGAFEGRGETHLGEIEASTDKTTPDWAVASGTDSYGRWASFEVDGVRQRMRWIEPGTFTMGSPDSDAEAFEDERPQHAVTLTRGFWMADTECTQALWEAVMDTNPSRFPSPANPVEQVSWTQVQGFVVALNQRLPGEGFALPTEAQWEYGARAGTSSARYGERDDVAWYGQRIGGETHEVAGKAPNAWGLHDMLGNVWEWTADANHTYASNSVTDPNPMTGPGRMLRGGSCFDDARYVRAAVRDWYVPGFRFDGLLGFRLVRGQPGSRSE